MESTEPATKFTELVETNNSPNNTTTGMTAPLVTLGDNVGTTTTTTAPIVDTTTVPIHNAKPTTRIEGMEKLESQPSSDEYVSGNMSESERRMKEEELSFYSASENEHGDDNIWGLLSGVGGNIYEWYVVQKDL